MILEVIDHADKMTTEHWGISENFVRAIKYIAGTQINQTERQKLREYTYIRGV